MTRFKNGFGGRVAVVTGGGSGMGREMVLQLTEQGCDVAVCDVFTENLIETQRLCAEAGNKGEVLTFIADVSDESQVLAFRDAVAVWRPHVHLLFNNAGIGGGGSVVDIDRESWEKTFGVCWYGVYYNTLAFLPMLIAADVAQIVNTSSINGFWASLGPNVPHSAYSSAKFAVKGFTEALITDLKMNAPHVRAAVVMPGHIGTDIALNSAILRGRAPSSLTSEQLLEVRTRMLNAGVDLSIASDDDLRAGMQAQGEAFRDNAPTSASQATNIILTAIQNDEWRILVGDDAIILDELVRANPWEAYEPSFVEQVSARGALGSIVAVG